MTSPPQSPTSAASAEAGPTEAGEASRAPPRGDPKEVLERVTEGLPVVDVIARQVRRELLGRVSLEDLVSYGREGLLTAARSFDPGLGVPFRRWANYRIRGGMLDGARSASLLPRHVYQRLRAVEAANHASEGASEDGSAAAPGSAEEADQRLADYLARIATAVAMGLLSVPVDAATGESVDPSPPADEVIARGEALAAVREAVDALPEQERHLIQRHYFEDVRLDEASRELGLSKSWGSRIHSRAIASITQTLRLPRPPR